MTIKYRVPLVRKPSKWVMAPPNQDLIDWIKANGIDPNTVLDGQMAVIEDGMLTLETIVKDADGKIVLERNGAPIIQRSSYTLISPPEDHGIEVIA